MIAILICSVLFAGANGELAKQSSDVDFVITKPEANILPHSQVVSPVLSAPLNLIKYGPLAGHPIQLLVTNRPNIAYVKPVKSYQKHHYPALPIELNFELKKYPNHLHSTANDLLIARNKFAAAPVLVDSNHRFDHLKANAHLNPLLESASYHYVADNLRNYLSLNPVGHYNLLNHLNQFNHLNHLSHADGPVHHPIGALDPVHHSPLHSTPVHHGPTHHNHADGPVHHPIGALNPVHHSPLHSSPVHHSPIHHSPIHHNPIHSTGHRDSIHGFNSHALPLIPEIDNYPSFIKYASPVSTSYFMKINHEMPGPKYHHSLTAKTELPFFEHKLPFFQHKLPEHYASASHYGYAPNFANHHHDSIKKKK